MKHYKFLEQVFDKIGNINSIIGVLESDKNNLSSNIDYICTLQEIKHEIVSSEMVSEMIQHSLASKAKLNDWEIANLNHMELICKNDSSVPVGLTIDLCKARMKCKNSWMLFHNGNASVQDVLVLLSEIVRIVNEIVSIKAETLKISKYDVILGIQDCKLNTKKVDAMFTEIGAFFRKFISEVSNKQKQDKIYYPKDIDKNKQILLGYDCLSYFGIVEDNIGIIHQDYASQSYSFGKDICFAIDYDESNYKVGLKSLLKKIGYRLYVLNLPVKWHKQPIGWNVNNIIPEVLGLLMSNHLMMSKEFVKFISPNLKKQFSFRGRVGHYQNIHYYFNQVQPSLFMHKSDEITLLAHIMLRYTLEKEMISDSLQVQDLPDAWVQGMKHYFNIVPKNDFEGFLQDDYWIDGLFGYFPCYMISTIIASQIFTVMKNSNSKILSEIEKGNFSSFLLWVNKNVCDYGAKYNSMEFLRKITGQKLNVNFYKNYLIDKYLNM
ncbi:carboxypeptidase [Ehrlichia sp. JZT12]